MPDRRALVSITIGEEGKRRQIAPGQVFSITDAQAKELDAYDPPCCEDPRRRQSRDAQAEEEGAQIMDRVGAERAEPEGRDTRQPSAEALAAGAAASRARAGAPGNAARGVARGDGNVSREQPPAGEDDPL